MENLNTLNKFPYDLRIQFADICMLSYKSNEAIHIHTVLLLSDNITSKHRDAFFQCLLLRFITFGHLGKTLIGYLALDIVLIEPLNDGIELVNPCLSLLPFFVSERLFGFGFGQLCDHFYEHVLVLTHIGGYIADTVQQELLNNGIADLM